MSLLHVGSLISSYHLGRINSGSDSTEPLRTPVTISLQYHGLNDELTRRKIITAKYQYRS
jgi:hypothetical protein